MIMIMIIRHAVSHDIQATRIPALLSLPDRTSGYTQVVISRNTALVYRKAFLWSPTITLFALLYDLVSAVGAVVMGWYRIIGVNVLVYAWRIFALLKL